MLYTPQKSRKNKKSISTKSTTEKKPEGYYGMVLVEGLDPLSKLFSKISKQPFSLVGYYNHNDIVTLYYILDGILVKNNINLDNLRDLVGQINIYPFTKPTNSIYLYNISISREDLLWSLFKKEYKELLGFKRLDIFKGVEGDTIEQLLTNLPIVNVNDVKTVYNNCKTDNFDMILDTFISMIETNQEFKNLVTGNKLESPIIIDNSETLKTISELRTQLSNIVNNVQQDKVPKIDLNSLINSVNNLSQEYNIEPIKTIDKPSSGLVVISDCDSVIPLSLKSGNHILLTTNNYNLTIFTKEELVEILQTIDKLVTDDRYDNLRADITKEIIERDYN